MGGDVVSAIYWYGPDSTGNAVRVLAILDDDEDQRATIVGPLGIIRETRRDQLAILKGPFPVIDNAFSAWAKPSAYVPTRRKIAVQMLKALRAEGQTPFDIISRDVRAVTYLPLASPPGDDAKQLPPPMVEAPPPAAAVPPID